MATLKAYLKKWNLTELKINAGFLQANINFQDADRQAAWEMYIELLTRVTTQVLNPTEGDEKTALTSVFSLFALTREVIKRHGPDCINFAKIAIIILNQIIRPFTAKWHKLSLEGALEEEENKYLFRSELQQLQQSLRYYSKFLSEIADVEDLTALEQTPVG